MSGGLTKLQFTPSEAAFVAELTVREVQKAIDEDWFDFVPRHSIGGTVRRSLGPAELLHLRIVKDACSHAVLNTEAKKRLHRELRQRIADVLLAYVGDYTVVVVQVGPIPHPAPTSAGRTVTVSWGAPERPLGDTMRAALEECFCFDEDSSHRCLIIHSRSGEWGPLYSWYDQMSAYVKEPVKISGISVDAESAWHQMVGRLTEATAAQLAVGWASEMPGADPVVRGTEISVHVLHQLAEQGATHEEVLAAYPSLDEQRLKLALLYARNHPRTGRPKDSCRNKRIA